MSFDALSGDGSARFSFGGTCTALASPLSPRHGRSARSTALVSAGDRRKVPWRSVQGIVEHGCVLIQHPRTLIQVVVQALSQHTNALIAAEINACSLVLINAGSVPMRGVVCGVSVGQRRSGSQTELVLDLEDESKLLGGGGCFAFLFGVDELPAESDIPPSKMIWTNYCAGVGASFLLHRWHRQKNLHPKVQSMYG
ncbi:hypothetical protein BU15DRAFT_66491 [Melanogaster broomeanus]|nr:hypothetical protein BU15DRAFT_66491 [Melanogaster broomeanus]